MERDCNFYELFTMNVPIMWMVLCGWGEEWREGTRVAQALYLYLYDSSLCIDGQVKGKLF